MVRPRKPSEQDSRDMGVTGPGLPRGSSLGERGLFVLIMVLAHCTPRLGGRAGAGDGVSDWSAESSFEFASRALAACVACATMSRWY